MRNHSEKQANTNLGGFLCILAVFDEVLGWKTLLASGNPEHTHTHTQRDCNITFSHPTRHIWTLRQDPLASLIDTLGIPLASFFNVQGSPIEPEPVALKFDVLGKLTAMVCCEWVETAINKNKKE